MQAKQRNPSPNHYAAGNAQHAHHRFFTGTTDSGLRDKKKSGPGLISATMCTMATVRNNINIHLTRGETFTESSSRTFYAADYSSSSPSTCARISAINGLPKRSSLRIPTPLTLSISLAVIGICSAISIKVASLNTTYGGTLLSSAIDLRSLRNLANSLRS